MKTTSTVTWRSVKFVQFLKNLDHNSMLFEIHFMVNMWSCYNWCLFWPHQTSEICVYVPYKGLPLAPLWFLFLNGSNSFQNRENKQLASTDITYPDAIALTIPVGINAQITSNSASSLVGLVRIGIRLVYHQFQRDGESIGYNGSVSHNCWN